MKENRNAKSLEPVSDSYRGVNKSERGSITVFVIVAFIFCMTILISLYWKSTNDQIMVLQAEQRIKEIYEKDVNNVDKIYGEVGDKGKNPEETTEIEIQQAINAEYYGCKVTNYTTEETAVGCWRLFYQDKDYTYLISDNIINLGSPIEKLYKEAGYSEYTGADVSIIGQGLNLMLKEKEGFSESNTNENIKAVAYLTNPEQWKKYKNDDAEYAIGGPTIELLVESFNATVAVENDGRRRITSLAVDDVAVGYNNAGTSGYFLTSYNHGIYNTENNNNSTWWELGSPARQQDDGTTNRVKHVSKNINA